MRRGWIVGGVFVVAGAIAVWISLREGDERPVAGLAPRTELASRLEAPAETVETPEIARETIPPVAIAEEVIEPELYLWNARAWGRVLDYASGAPIAGATVELETHEEDGVASTKTVSTDANGRFELDGLRLRALNPPWSSEFDVAVRAQDYAPLFARGRDRTPRRPRDLREALELALGDLRLRRGTHVAGRVVRAADGTAVGGATIHCALRPSRESGESAAWISDRFLRELGVSGPDGRFELREPVTAISPGAYLFAWSEQGVGWANFAVIEGGPRIEDVEIRLSSPRALAVLVVDARGQGIHDAEMSLLSQDEPMRSLAFLANHPRAEGALAWARSFRGRTDEQGGWRVGPLPTPQKDEVWTLTVQAEDGRGTWIAVTLAAPDEPPVQVVLPDLEDAEARTIRGRVVDPQDLPFAGVRVKLDQRAVLTDSEGRFCLTLATGREEYVRLLVSGTGIAGGYVTRRAADFGPEELELVFPRAAPIAGLVTDQAGRALASVELSLETDDRSIRRMPTWTDEHGRFRIEDAPEGESRLVGPDALPGNREPVNAILVHGGDEAVHFVCDMQPEPTGRLELRVIDAITGAPRAPLEVALGRPTAEEHRSLFMPEFPLTRTLGLVKVDELPAGNWRVDVCVEDGTWSMVRVEVEAGVLTEAELLVGLGGTLTGRVEAQASLEGAWVAVESKSRGPRPRAVGLRTGGPAAIDPATGRFRFENLDPGEYTLTVEGSAISAPVVVNVLAGEETQVELRAQTSARLRIVSDVPWQGGALRVRVRTGEVEHAQFERTFPKGAPLDFEVEAEPGLVRWEIEERASPGIPRTGAPPSSWSGEATLSAGEEHTVRLDLRR